MAPDLNKEEIKEALKEALKEWLDSRYAEFGKWAIFSILATVLVGLLYFIIWTGGLPKVTIGK